MIESHCWQKSWSYCHNLTVPVPKEHHSVEYIGTSSRITDIILRIGWGTNTNHAECGQLSVEP